MNIYQQALDVQNACNGVAIINTLARILPDIRKDAEQRGDASTDALNSHPVIVAFLDKLASLANCQNYASQAIMDAHDLCDERSKVLPDTRIIVKV